MDGMKSLQRQVRVLQVLVLLSTSIWAISAMKTVVEAGEAPQTLRVKRLAVVDAKGVKRVVIAAPVPDPLFHGKPLKREGAASGIVIYDAAGLERGGYLTSDEQSNGAMLTLDGARNGASEQVFTAYANPDNGATLSLANQKGSGITMTTFNDPVIQMKKDKQVIFNQPPGSPVLH